MTDVGRSVLVDPIEPESDARPVAASASAPDAPVPTPTPSTVPDERPWRLRRPVIAGLVLYGTLALVIATIGWFWIRERESGRQEGLLTIVRGAQDFSGIDPDRSIRVLEDDVLAKSPTDDTRRRALLALASAFDAAKRYDDANRTYETARREWPAGRAWGSLVVPWANMLVSAGQAARAKELLAPAGATDGYGTPDEVEIVRARVANALESPPLAPAAPVAK